VRAPKERVLALSEIARLQLDPSLGAKDVPAAASSLHVMHAGAVLLGATVAIELGSDQWMPIVAMAY
jgi:hypothetical protein